MDAWPRYLAVLLVMVVRWITAQIFMHFPVDTVVDHISCKITRTDQQHPTAVARRILIKWHADDVVVTSHHTHLSKSNS